VELVVEKRMNRVIPVVGLVLAFALTSTPSLAQQNARIGYVYPAGSRQGAELELVIGGRSLAGIVSVYISGKGIQTFAFGYAKPENAPTPAIAETVTLRMTIAPDAPTGRRELRLETPSGLTNPLPFWVGQLPEFKEKPSRTPAPKPSLMDVALPAIINGQVLPGEIDRYRFTAKKGQKLVFAASARDLVPYLPDAVPGWFQAVMAIYDADGKELLYADDFRFHPDPVLYFEPPADGTYVVEIRDALFRGREDFVYRIAAGELPYVKQIFPLGGRAGAGNRVQLTGWNLPSDVLSLKFPEPGVFPVFVRKQHAVLSERRLDLLIDAALDRRAESVSSTESFSNRLPFAVDALPECLEREPNDDAKTAQDIAMPMIVNGRIDKSGDWDVFRIRGKAGQTLIADVRARRLQSPLDSVLRVTDAAGKQIALNDDHEDKGAGLVTHHADSLVQVKLPADGDYYVHLGDTQKAGGTEYAYRLRLSEPQMDFDLRIVPSSLNVRGGGTVALEVFALRKDGFTGPIDLSLKDAPPGFRLHAARVPDGQDRVRLTLAAPPINTKEAISLSLVGRSTLGGQEVVRTVEPAEDMLQAFIYHHVVPVSEFKVLVSGRDPGNTTARYLSDLPVKIPAGGTGKLRVAVVSDVSFDQVRLQLDEPPDGLSIKDQTPRRNETEVVFECDAGKLKPGLKGNLILNAYAGKQESSAKKKTTLRQTPMGMLPALPFEIVAK